MGVGSGELLGEALALVAKRGRVVVTNIRPVLEVRANLSLLDLTLMEKGWSALCPVRVILVRTSHARGPLPRGVSWTSTIS